MYNIERYRKLMPQSEPVTYEDSPVVHDDVEEGSNWQTRSQDITGGYPIYGDLNEINTSSRIVTTWDRRKQVYVDRKIESDEDLNLDTHRGRRKHQPHYENRFRIDISSNVFIKRRKTGLEIIGASEELALEITANESRLPINVTITLDEYNRLIR